MRVLALPITVPSWSGMTLAHEVYCFRFIAPMSITAPIATPRAIKAQIANTIRPPTVDPTTTVQTEDSKHIRDAMITTNPRKMVANVFIYALLRRVNRGGAS